MMCCVQFTKILLSVVFSFGFEETRPDSTVCLRKLFSIVVPSLTPWNVQTVVIGLVSPL